MKTIGVRTSNLKSIVPPLELCKQIPAGEFEDSALVWVYDDVVGFLCRTSGCEQIHKKEWQLEHNHPRKIAIRRKSGHEIYPAPTLEEIILALPKQDKNENKLRISPVGHELVWSIGYDYFELQCSTLNLAEAALRLFLKEMKR